jgi:neutral ceramidase
MTSRFPAFLFLTLTLPLTAAALEAGVAACDITPDVAAYKVPMAGYGARQGKPSTGVHDPIHAKVLVLQDGATRIALVTADLRSVTPQLKQQILDKTRDLSLSEENLMLAGSHNHSGPAIFPEPFWQFQFGIHDPAVVEAMSDSIAKALREAAANLAPARIGFAQELQPQFTRNRRWTYNTQAREAAGETPCITPRLSVMRIEGEDGAVRAVIAHYATHPTILGADNFEISAEWPGVLQRQVEAAFPGAIALYLNGAEGDQAPAGAQGEDAFAKIEDFGARLAACVIALANGIEGNPDVALGYAFTRYELGEPVFSDAAKSGPYTQLLESALEALPRTAILQQLRIGDAVLAGLPGEPVCAVGNDLEARLRALGADHALVVGLANDYIGYILNAPEYAHGGYEVDQRSFYGQDLGERLIQASADSAKPLFE